MTLRRTPLLACLVAMGLMLSACASTNGPGDEGVSDADPWRGVNEPVFSFNTGFDDHIFGPVARGWRFITPRFVRTGFDNFFRNTAFTTRFISGAGQGDVKAALTEVVRFVFNTGFGLAGLVDVATPMGIAQYDNDMGKMMARWGIPTGPYAMVPFLGPTTPRDGIGLALDVVSNPLFWFAPIGSVLIFTVNDRAIADDQIESARRGALDYYVFVRDAYTSHRESVVNTRGPTGARTRYGYYNQGAVFDDLYEWDEESETDAVPNE